MKNTVQNVDIQCEVSWCVEGCSLQYWFLDGENLPRADALLLFILGTFGGIW